MATSITPLNITESYQALKILKQSQLNETEGSAEDYINSNVILNIVQAAVDTFGSTYAFTNDGIPALTIPLIDQAALLADNETVTGSWTFSSPVSHSGVVSSTSTFTSSGQHRCRVYVSTSNQSISDATPTGLNFLGEGYDVGALHDTGVNPGRITIPTGGSGLYQFLGAVQFAANATGYRYVAIYKNGSEMVRSSAASASASTTSDLQVQLHDQCNQNDFYELYVYQNSSGALDVNKNITFFAAMKVW